MTQDTDSASLADDVRRLCRQGYRDLDEGDPARALRWFYRAWTLLPEPQHEHRAGGWVLTAIGDAYLASRRFSLAIDTFRSAARCLNNRTNPVIRFKLGQALYEAGDTDEAGRELARALKHGGESVFEGEHTKYLALAREARPPHKR